MPTPSTRYRGPRWGRVWLSDCLVHLTPSRACPRCMQGHYASSLRPWLAYWVSRRWPQVWLWWRRREGGRFRPDVETVVRQKPRRQSKASAAEGHGKQ